MFSVQKVFLFLKSDSAENVYISICMKHVRKSLNIPECLCCEDEGQQANIVGINIVAQSGLESTTF